MMGMERREDDSKSKGWKDEKNKVVTYKWIDAQESGKERRKKVERSGKHKIATIQSLCNHTNLFYIIISSTLSPSTLSSEIPTNY